MKKRLSIAERMMQVAYEEGEYQQLFTSTGSIVLPAGLVYLEAFVVGGGAGGSGGHYMNNWINSMGSGAAGGYTKKIYTSAEIQSLKNTTKSVVVGVGGAAGGGSYNASSPGAAGGTSSFLGLAATGGNPSNGLQNWAAGYTGVGGVGSGGDSNLQGASGSQGWANSTAVPPAGAGWQIAGGTYGGGGTGGVGPANGNPGISGCVYIIYKIKKMKGA